MIKKLLKKIIKTKENIPKAVLPKNVLDVLYYEVKKFEVVVDVGAYKGEFTSKLLSINKNLKIHCFEPSKQAFTDLQVNFLNNKNVKLSNAAVSNFKGLAKLNINSFHETNSLLESANLNQNINNLTKTIGGENVEVISLDDYCYENNIQKINFIKIDAQGNSYNIILGLHTLLTKNKVDYLYVETEFLEIYTNEKLFSEIELLMRSYGYSIVDIFNLNYIDSKLGWCDVLFKNKYYR